MHQQTQNKGEIPMDLQNLMPQQAQPISRITSGQPPTELAELSEEVLAATANRAFGSGVLSSGTNFEEMIRDVGDWWCSYEDAEDAD
jgi:bacteriocin leader peptide (microcyclamide/patellamide family)